jgi:hypothetical protein
MMRHSLKKFGWNADGEAKPSPHIRRHSRKTQTLKLV